MAIGAECGAATGPIPAEAQPEGGPQTGEARSKPTGEQMPLGRRNLSCTLLPEFLHEQRRHFIRIEAPLNCI
jgi:hypothetical protein